MRQLVPHYTTPIRHIANLILFVLLAVSLPNMLEYVIFQATPFNFNVNITERSYADVCVGDRVVPLTLIRDVRPSSGVKATANTELVRFDNGLAIETDWKEIRSFTYQENGRTTTTIEVLLPLELPEGTYGFIETTTINPFPGVYKTKTFNAEDAKFNVINCDI